MLLYIPGLLLLLVTLPPHHGQTAIPASQVTAPEAAFRRGSSFIELSSTLVLSQGSLLGFSFRTCHPAGQLVKQYGDIHNSFLLSLTNQGAVKLEVKSGELNRVEEVGTGLADGA